MKPAVYIGANDVTALVADDMTDAVLAAFEALPDPEFGEKVLPLYLAAHPTGVTRSDRLEAALGKIVEAWDHATSGRADYERDLGWTGSNDNPAQIFAWFAAEALQEPDACPICAIAFKPDDLCQTDIELGTCHAECLAGSPLVDLETGDPLPDGTEWPKPFRYGD